MIKTFKFSKKFDPTEFLKQGFGSIVFGGILVALSKNRFMVIHTHLCYPSFGCCGPLTSVRELYRVQIL